MATACRRGRHACPAGARRRPGRRKHLGRADFLAQVRQVPDNVQTAPQAAGATLFDVAKLTVLVVDHSQNAWRYSPTRSSRAGAFTLRPPAP